MQLHTCSKNNRKNYASPLLIGGFMLILLLLSACSTTGGNITHNNTNNTTLPLSTINPVLKSQGDMQLQTFQQWIGLIKQYHGDVSSYQKQYNANQQALQSATTNMAYKSVLQTLNIQVKAIQMPAMKIEDQQLQLQLLQEVNAWGQQHQFHNSFDDKNYPLGYEYGANGIASWTQNTLSAGQSIADLQQAIEDLNMYLYNFQAMTQNAN